MDPCEWYNSHLLDWERDHPHPSLPRTLGLKHYQLKRHKQHNDIYHEQIYTTNKVLWSGGNTRRNHRFIFTPKVYFIFIRSILNRHGWFDLFFMCKKRENFIFLPLFFRDHPLYRNFMTTGGFNKNVLIFYLGVLKMFHHLFAWLHDSFYWYNLAPSQPFVLKFLLNLINKSIFFYFFFKNILDELNN